MTTRQPLTPEQLAAARSGQPVSRPESGNQDGSPSPRVGTVNEPPEANPLPVGREEQVARYTGAIQALQSMELDSPILSSIIANNPTTSLILPESALMLGGGTRESDPEVQGDILSRVSSAFFMAMPNATGYRSYAETMFKTPVQQMFWQDMGSKFDTGGRDILAYLFSVLDERNADRIASKAFAWTRNNPRFDQGELLFRMWNWQKEERQEQAASRGLFGFLDKGQNALEDAIVDWPIGQLNTWLGTPDEAIRRSGLTGGQQIAYQFGLDPDDAMWSLTSGAFDAVVEVVVDPLNALAAVGIATKGIKGLAVGTKAVQKGRAVFALKSAVPFYGRSVSPLATRSPLARVIYAFGSKTSDDVMEGLLKTRPSGGKFPSMADEIAGLLKEGRDAEVLLKYPELKLTKAMTEAARNTDGRGLVAIMKDAYLADNITDASVAATRLELANAEKRLSAAEEALRQEGILSPGAFQDTSRLKAPTEEVMKAELKMAAQQQRPNQVFTIVDIPRAHKARDFAHSAFKNADSSPARYLRTWKAGWKAGHDIEKVNIADPRNAVRHLSRALERSGINPNSDVALNLLNRFVELPIGDRQAFMIREFMPAIGKAQNNPFLQYQLLEFFSGAEIRDWGKGASELGSRLDSWEDPSTGLLHTQAFLETQMARNFDMPLQYILSANRRFQRANMLRKVGLGNSKGLVGGTRTRRADLVDRFRRQLNAGNKLSPEFKALPKKQQDEELWAMAYSMLGDGANDARGWWSKAGGWAKDKGNKPLHAIFTTAMLAGSPIRWMWKVVFMEEQLRSAIFHMPSAYVNPIGYGLDFWKTRMLGKTQARSQRALAHITRSKDTILGGAETATDGRQLIENKLGKKVTDELFAGKTINDLSDVRRTLGSYLHGQMIDERSTKHLTGGALAQMKMKRVAHQLNTDKAYRTKHGLTPDFDPINDLTEINQNFISEAFGFETAKAASSTTRHQWKVGIDAMPHEARKTYGEAWGGEVHRLNEDQGLQFATRRMLAREGGGSIPSHLSGEAFSQTRAWDMVGANARRKFPGLDDATTAERYLSEVTESYAEWILRPLMERTDRLDLLTNLVDNKRILSGSLDINLKKGIGANNRAMGGFAQNNADLNFPSEINSVFDNRFLDGDDLGTWKTVTGRIIKFFGGDVSLALNRRPAWMKVRNRWFKQYRATGMSQSLANELSEVKANQMVNYVMYNMSEAPAMVKKLNRVIPFFGALYEVMGTWTYKLPKASAGYWVAGVPVFARKMSRAMQGMVRIGLVDASEDEATGKTLFTWNGLRDPDPIVATPAGQAASKMSFHLRRGPEVAFAHMASILHGTMPWDGLNEKERDSLVLTEAGYQVSLGNPIDPFSNGPLSFAQFQIGQSPQLNLATSYALSKIMPVSGPQRTTSKSNETLAQLADRLDVDFKELLKRNRDIIYKMENGRVIYDALFTGKVTPSEISLPEGLAVEIPGSSVFNTMIEEGFFPFGHIDTPQGALVSVMPTMGQYVLKGFGIHSQPTDDEWLVDGFEGTAASWAQTSGRAAMMSQITEATMYLESTERLFSEKILPLSHRVQGLRDPNLGEENQSEEYAAAVKELEEASTDAWLRVQDLSGSAMIMRGLAGAFFPNSGRARRQNYDQINDYYGSKEFADEIRANFDNPQDAVIPETRRWGSVEEMEDFLDQVGNWLFDSTGDAARAHVRTEYPDLLAYMSPKTFWANDGVAPQDVSFDEWNEQVENGDVKPTPLPVTIARHSMNAVDADHYTARVVAYGPDPKENAANALDDYAGFMEMQDAFYTAKDAVYMWDDMNGGAYLEHLNRKDDDYSLVEAQADDQRVVMEVLSDMLDWNLDGTMSVAEIADHKATVKKMMVIAGEMMDELRDPSDGSKAYDNPFEQEMNRWWTDVYTPFSEGLDELWDVVSQVRDNEEKSLAFEKIKQYQNDWSRKRFPHPEDESVTFPGPLEIKWARKDELEKQATVQKRLTLPLTWLSLDDVDHIIELSGERSRSFFPTSIADMVVYDDWTEAKVEIDEAQERGEITYSEATGFKSELKDKVMQRLLDEGRNDEVGYMLLWPIEKLYLLNQLPVELEYLIGPVRSIKQDLAAIDKGPKSDAGRAALRVLYQNAIDNGWKDLAGFGAVLDNIGLNLYDETDWDSLLPRLIADDWSDF